MHEPLNLERLKAEVSDDDARVDLKGVVALNLNLEHEKPPMCARALTGTRNAGPRTAPTGVITLIVDAEASVLCVRSDLRKLSVSHMD